MERTNFFQLKADLACELTINHNFRTFAIKDIESSKRMIKGFDSQWKDGLFARFLICKNDKPCGYIGIWRHSEKGPFEVGLQLCLNIGATEL